MTLTAFGINASGGSPAYTSQQFRQAMSSLLRNDSTRPVGSRSGYGVGHQPTVLTVSSSTWTIGPFSCVIDPAFTTTQGPYFVSSDANATGSVTAAPSSPNTRVDFIYAQVNDTDIDSSGSRSVTVNYLAGTSANPGLAPTLPARSFLLATINVPSSPGTPTISVNNQFSVGSGGILPVTAAATYPANPVEGQYIDDRALDGLFRYDGANFVAVTTGQWTSYNPTWAATSGGASIGNGGISAAYQVIGKSMRLRLYCAFGSTTAFGTGTWVFSLPAGFTSANLFQGGASGIAFDSSSGLSWVVTMNVAPSQSQFSVLPAKDTGSFACDAGRPFAWAASDTLYLGPGEIQIA